MSQAELRLATVTLLLLTTALITLAPRVQAQTITLTSSPDCVASGQLRIDCVAKGTDNALWHTWWSSGSWNGWESFGGTLTSGPSITSSPPSRLDVFARGADNALWHLVWDGTLHSWESLGGIALTSDPDCTSARFDSIDCFARASDNALWHISFNAGTWSAWESVGGILTSGPGAASGLSSNEKILLVFVRAADNAMWEIDWVGGAWKGWEKRGGILTSDPDAVTSELPQDPSSNRFDIVVKGPDNGIWWKWWRNNFGWSTGCQGCDGYESLSGISNAGPTIASRGWNNLEVFALGIDNNLYHRGWDGSAWSPWDAVPMTIAATTVTTSSILATTSSESSTLISSSAATSTSPSMETSSVTTSSQPTSTSLGTTDLTGLIQQNGTLILGVIAFIVIVLVFATRSRQKQIASQRIQQRKTSIFCPNCGRQISSDNTYCPKCGGKV